MYFVVFIDWFKLDCFKNEPFCLMPYLDILQMREI